MVAIIPTPTEIKPVKPASTPFHAYLQSRESRVWSPADTVTVLSHIQQIERLALALVERAERRDA